MRRLLDSGGGAIFTIHDEHTWRRLSEDEQLRTTWARNGWWPNEEFAGEMGQDVLIGGSGSYWGAVTTFFKTDWIRKEWGQYFDVVDIVPFWEGYQTAVVLRKS